MAGKRHRDRLWHCELNQLGSRGYAEEAFGGVTIRKSSFTCDSRFLKMTPEKVPFQSKRF